jgi:hypothetical protein
VLEEIKAAVEQRVPPDRDSQEVRKRGRVRAWVPSMAIRAKRLYKDQDELQDLRRKLQSVVDAFTVRSSLSAMQMSILTRTFQVSSLLLNELISLQNGRDVNVVHDLARSILAMQVLQVQQNAKRDAEAGKFT